MLSLMYSFARLCMRSLHFTQYAPTQEYLYENRSAVPCQTSKHICGFINHIKGN